MTDPADDRCPRPAAPAVPAAFQGRSSPAGPLAAQVRPGIARQAGPRQARHDNHGPAHAPSWPGKARVPALIDAWQRACDAFRAGRSRFARTVPGQIWAQLRELGFINSSLQFAALFTLSFVPFLMLLSAVLGADLSRELVTRSGFSAQASSDITMLFTHGRTALTSLSIMGIILVVFAADAISHILQTWYAKIFRAPVHGWKAIARRAEWLAGVFGFMTLQILIGRRVQPHSIPLVTSAAQFLLAVAFWWWSLHCLLAGQVSWRRLFLAGLTTAVCYTGIGIYVACFGSSSILDNEASYGPIGAIMTLLTIEAGLGVAVHLGAVIGAAIARKTSP